MSTQGRTVRIEVDEAVAAVCAREVGEMPEALFVRIGDVRLVGGADAVMSALARAFRECYRSRVAGHVARDGLDVALLGRQANALPPLVGPSEVDGTLSRGAVAPAKLLALDGGAAISDHPASSGGGIRESFYLIRNEGDGA